MENKDFDKHIKDGIGKFEVDYNPKDWDAMEKRLDLEDIMESSEMEDVYLDTMVYGNLNNMDVPYNPSDWHLMEARLDKAFAYRKYIVYKYKLAEIGLMLLFIFTLFQFLPSKQNTIEEANPQITKLEQITTTAKVENNSTENTSPNPTFTPANSSAVLAPIVNENNTSASLVAEDNIMAFNKSKAVQAIAAITPDDILSTTSLPTKAVANSDILNVQSALTNNQFVSILHVLEERDHVIAFELPRLEDLPGFDNQVLISDYLNFPALQLIEFEKDQTIDFDCKICQIGKAITAVKVGMYSISDLNMVTTPLEQFGEGKFARTYAYGYGGGFSIGLDLGNRWTIQTGIAYSSKIYEPFSLVEETYGTFDTRYVTESFSRFEFDVIQIPLEIQYQMNKSSKWQIYAMGGASLNTIMQAQYDRNVETSSDFGFRSGNAGQGAGQTVQDVREQNSEHFSSEDLPIGFFEGGTFTRNSFMTLNAGIGLERVFTARWSFFVEPSFQYYFGSFSGLDLGPTNDRINTARLNLGAKVNLK